MIFCIFKCFSSECTVRKILFYERLISEICAIMNYLVRQACVCYYFQCSQLKTSGIEGVLGYNPGVRVFAPQYLTRKGTGIR